MKTRNYLKSMLILATVAIGMSGCVKSSDPDFDFNSAAYVLQQNTVYGEGYLASFSPYVAIASTYGLISDARLTHNGLPVSNFRKVGGYIYETQRLQNTMTPTIPNGTYMIVATNEEGETATRSFVFDIDNDKKLGNLNVKSIEYNPNRGVSASWDEVENATAYYFMYSIGVKNENGGISYYRVNNNYVSWGSDPKATSGNVDISIFPIDAEVQIAVVAAYASPTGKGSIFLESAYYRLVVGKEGLTVGPGF